MMGAFWRLFPVLKGVTGSVLRACCIGLLFWIYVPTQESLAQANRPSGIKGEDDRSRVDITEYPWRAIGRLNKSGSFCTGVLIAKDKVLTAAHCFWNKRTNRWSLARFYHFVIGYEKGEYKGHAKGLSYITAHGAKPDRPFPKFERSDDWAILTLDKPLGGEFGTVPVFTGEKIANDLKRKKVSSVYQGGYSRDFAYVLTVNKDCKIISKERLSKKSAPVYFHQCDATQGDSGSPIFQNIGPKIGVVAIHSATAWEKDGKVVGVAVPSEQFINKLK